MAERGRHIPQLRRPSIQQTRRPKGRDAAKIRLHGKLEVDRHNELELLHRRWRAFVVVGVVDERRLVRSTRLDEEAVALEGSLTHRVRAHAPGHREAERSHCVLCPPSASSLHDPINPCAWLSMMSACPRPALHPLPTGSRHEHQLHT